MSDDNNRKGKEEDEVAEAYESISKKLEHLRGKDDPEEDDKEDDKEESKDEDEVEELEDPEEEEEDKPETDAKEQEEEVLDPLPGTGEKEEESDEPKPTFRPRENDPLDEEEAEDFDKPASVRKEPVDTPQAADSLDDLVNESTSEDSNIPHIRPAHKESSFPQRPDYASDISFSKPSYSEPNPSNYFNRHATDRPARRGNIWHLIILILIGVAVIGGTVYLLKYQFGGVSGPAATPEPSPIVSEPTPEPTPAFDRSKFKIRVLNGTTTSGLAKTVSEKLKELGYQIDKTGNAPKQDAKQTIINVKTSAVGLAEELIKDLSSDYQASVSGELKDSDNADAEVIIGQK